MLLFQTNCFDSGFAGVTPVVVCTPLDGSAVYKLYFLSYADASAQMRKKKKIAELAFFKMQKGQSSL